MGHPENSLFNFLIFFQLRQKLRHTVCIAYLRLDDGMAAIERGLAVFIPPMAAAAFAALKLLSQFGNLERFYKHTEGRCFADV